MWSESKQFATLIGRASIQGQGHSRHGGWRSGEWFSDALAVGSNHCHNKSKDPGRQLVGRDNVALVILL